MFASDDHPSILGIASCLPPKATQADLLTWLTESSTRWPALDVRDDLRAKRPLLERLFNASRISGRHLAVPPSAAQQLPLDTPFSERMDTFHQHATPLSEAAATDALARADVRPSSIGKLITVSSTGFGGPGLDLALCKGLGLSPNISRANLNLMGCAAALNGIEIAADFVHRHPDRNALLVCAELSSVNAKLPNMRTSAGDFVNDLLAYALFGDGCVAAVIGPKTRSAIGSFPVEILASHSRNIPGTEDGIVLSTSNDGIRVNLSPALPSYIEANLATWVGEILAKNGLVQSDIAHWAIHAGGAKILLAVQRALGLDESALRQSWEALDDVGNIISGSTLMVLERIRQERRPGYGIAMSFSPGLFVEGVLFRCRDS